MDSSLFFSKFSTLQWRKRRPQEGSKKGAKNTSAGGAPRWSLLCGWATTTPQLQEDSVDDHDEEDGSTGGGAGGAGGGAAGAAAGTLRGIHVKWHVCVFYTVARKAALVV